MSRKKGLSKQEEVEEDPDQKPMGSSKRTLAKKHVQKKKKPKKTKKPEKVKRKTERCVIQTRLNFLNIDAAFVAAMERPHLAALQKRYSPQKKCSSVSKMINNVLKKSSLNPREQTRWKTILTVEGNTRQVGLKTAPKLAQILFFTGLYTIYEDMYIMRGRTSKEGKNKNVQTEDIINYFERIRPIKYGRSLVILENTINTKKRKKPDTDTDIQHDSSSSPTPTTTTTFHRRDQKRQKT